MERAHRLAALATLLTIVCSFACSSPTTPGGTSATPVANPPVTAFVTALAVADLPETVNYGQSVQLKAVATYNNGDQRQVTDVAWTSSNGDVASVSADGVVRASGIGDAEITATVNGVQGKGRIVVPVPPPPLAQLAVKVDDHGSTVALAAITRVTFDLSESTGAGLKYEVAFGDGDSTVSSEPLLTHKYAQAAARPLVVRATVTDVVGRIHSVQTELRVNALFDPFGDYWGTYRYGDPDRVSTPDLVFVFPSRVLYNLDTNERRQVTSYFVTATNDMQLVLDDGTTADGPIYLVEGCCGSTHMTLTFHGGSQNGRTFDFLYDPRY